MLVGGVWAAPLRAQVLSAPLPDSTLQPVLAAAGFERAVRLAVAPDASTYIVDAGRNALVRLRGDARRDLLGGPGLRAGAFDEPADVDPTNGLLLYVADAGNGRIQLFSREFLPLRAVPIPRGPDALSVLQPGSLQAREVVGEDGGVGRPIAVATSPTDELFVLDASRPAVWVFDAAQRPITEVGGFDAGEGALVDPVDIATDERLLYVADAARRAIIAYEHAGRLVRVIGSGRSWTPSRVVRASDALFVVESGRIWILTPQGRLVQTLAPGLDEALMDVAWRDDVLYLLTPTRLFVSPLDLR